MQRTIKRVEIGLKLSRFLSRYRRRETDEQCGTMLNNIIRIKWEISRQRWAWKEREKSATSTKIGTLDLPISWSIVNGCKHRLLHLLRYRNVLGELFYKITCNSKVASDLVTAKISAVESVVCVNRLKKKVNFKIFSAVVDWKSPFNLHHKRILFVLQCSL